MSFHPTLAAAVDEFDRVCMKSPLSHTTLFVVKRRGGVGKTIGYRVFSSRYLLPIPHGRGEYLVPLRQH